MEADENDSIAHAWLGRALYRRGRYEEAAEHLRAAIRLNPKEASFQTALEDTERQLARAKKN